MREIKFRGYSSSLHTWIYGDLQTPIKNNNLPFIRQLDTDEWFSVEKDSIGQYTGFKDKNGTEIYEGDIIKYNGANHIVVWNEESASFCFTFDGETLIPFTKNRYNGMYEVIGNKYEEKLKEDK